MKFISFIASTMLIVLISQCSMGLPLNNKVVGELCSEGFKMIKGQCVPIESSTIGVIENFSNPPETVTKSLPEQNTVVVKDKKIIGGCPPGTKSGKNGICQPLEFSTTTEITRESTTPLSLLSTGSNDLQQTVTSDTLEVTTDLTTDLNDSIGTGGVDNVQGCPKGTKADEQGACIAIQDSSTKKMVTDPKVLLNKDGSCPKQYKKIDGQCVYIGLETKTVSNSHGSNINGNIAGGLKPKLGVDQQQPDEVEPVLENNICPQGTVHSDFGLCKKITYPLSHNVLLKPDGSCANGYQLINGKCTSKSGKILEQLGLSVTTIRMPLKPTYNDVPINTDNLLPLTTMVTKT